MALGTDPAMVYGGTPDEYRTLVDADDVSWALRPAGETLKAWVENVEYGEYRFLDKTLIGPSEEVGNYRFLGPQRQLLHVLVRESGTGPIQVELPMCDEIAEVIDLIDDPGAMYQRRFTTAQNTVTLTIYEDPLLVREVANALTVPPYYLLERPLRQEHTPDAIPRGEIRFGLPFKPLGGSILVGDLCAALGANYEFRRWDSSIGDWATLSPTEDSVSYGELLAVVNNNNWTGYPGAGIRYRVDPDAPGEVQWAATDEEWCAVPPTFGYGTTEIPIESYQCDGGGGWIPLPDAILQGWVWVGTELWDDRAQESVVRFCTLPGLVDAQSRVHAWEGTRVYPWRQVSFLEIVP